MPPITTRRLLHSPAFTVLDWLQRPVLLCAVPQAGAARGPCSHTHAVRGAHPAWDTGSCATYKIPGSARTDALFLLWLPISRLPGRFHFTLVRAKLAYKMPPFAGRAAVGHMDKGDAFALVRAPGKRNHVMEGCFQSPAHTAYHGRAEQNEQVTSAVSKICRAPSARCLACFLPQYAWRPVSS